MPRTTDLRSALETPHSFSGTFREMGAEYGETYERELYGFYTQEFGRYRYSKSFVVRCSEHIRKQTPKFAAFLKGIQSNSRLTFEQLTLLSLHEDELYHRDLLSKYPHCSTVGFSVATAKGGNTIVGQNWDWGSQYATYTSWNRYRSRNGLKALCLSFPGLPVCAGLNSAGFTLQWTGAGYYPPVMPKVGVPTYALCFELLFQRSTRQALQFLKRVKNAGSFIFYLGDSSGSLAVVEAVPGKMFVEQPDYSSRANLFESPAAIQVSKQRPPRDPKKCNSLIRCAYFTDELENRQRKPSVSYAKELLSHPSILVDRVAHATLVQMVADCRARKLYIRAWLRSNARWQTLRP